MEDDNLLRWEVARDLSAQQLIELLPISEIDTMVARRHDLTHQMAICERMMAGGTYLPYPFVRAAVLLAKEQRYADEVRICEYAVAWADRIVRERRPGAENALSYIGKLASRLPRARARLAAQA